MKAKYRIGWACLLMTSLCPMSGLARNCQDTNPSAANSVQDEKDWKLVWNDEFNTNGQLDPKVWNYEEGFKRNHEAQWYQKANAYCKDGNLVIEARKEKKLRKNPRFDKASKQWPTNIEKIEYTSASVNTREKKEFLYGRVEVRAKVPTAGGAWPAIWLLGRGMDWPSNGEIDMMEFYRKQGVPHILANACWGTDKQWTAKWNSKAVPFAHFTDRDAQWADKFHIWRMDWDEQSIKLYLDDELLNEIRQDEAVNGKLGNGEQPFKKPQYLLLNLALGGDNGGEIADEALPMKYLIDYVRVYQKNPNSSKTSVENTYSGTEITPEGAWCWFADPRAMHFESKDGSINKSYIGYIDVHGNIKAMQYDFKEKKQTEVLVRSYFQPDDHDNPTFLALPDNRIMVFYSRHTDEPCFYYRVSRKPGDITTLGEEKVIKTKDNTTYPSPFILSDDPTHFYLCWRGVRWHPTIAKITLPDANDDVKVEWGPYQMVQSTGARPYAKYASNGKDKIYLTYTTGHPDNESPNWLYFNYVDINKLQLQDIHGKVLSNIADGPLKVTRKAEYLQQHPETVVDAPQERNWVFQVTPDKQGNPVIAMVRISTDKKLHDFYYMRWNGKKWQKTYIGNSGGHFHQSPNLERCYSAGMAIDPAHVNIVYASMPVVGKYGRVYEIFKYTIGDDGKIVSTEQITKNSKKNNVRPYILPDSENTPLRLTWMNGDYYDWIVSKQRPRGYCTALHADFAGFENAVNTVTNSYGMKNGEYDAKKVKFDAKKDFHVSLDLDLKQQNYQGCLLKLGKLSYWLDGESLKPEVRYKKQVWKSTNKLATSDCWKTEDRGTGGKWYEPTKLDKVHLQMDYEAGVLSVYLNGLLDQKIYINP